VIVSEGGGRTASGTSIVVQTLITSRVSSIGVRFLVVESSFSYVEIVSFTLNDTGGSGIPYGSSFPPYSINTSVSLNQSANKWMYVINGYDL
jgi:hypothetical protein